MRVAFTGPSGSGKTTLVKHVEETYGLKWLNGSSGEIKTPEENQDLTERGLTVGRGHAKVIQSGHATPGVAWMNQEKIFEQRSKLLLTNDNFVTDRSPIDNLVYATIQCGPYLDTTTLQKFRDDCYGMLRRLTHVIYVPTMFQVEDNGSRIPNYWYQKAMGAVFQMYIDSYWESDDVPKILTITKQNLQARYTEIAEFLNTH